VVVLYRCADHDFAPLGSFEAKGKSEVEYIILAYHGDGGAVFGYKVPKKHRKRDERISKYGEYCPLYRAVFVVFMQQTVPFVVLAYVYILVCFHGFLGLLVF
jgi:hypothetical protein